MERKEMLLQSCSIPIPDWSGVETGSYVKRIQISSLYVCVCVLEHFQTQQILLMWATHRRHTARLGKPMTSQPLCHISCPDNTRTHTHTCGRLQATIPTT